jgi:hypothetical protein
VRVFLCLLFHICPHYLSLDLLHEVGTKAGTVRWDTCTRVSVPFLVRLQE